MIILQGYSTNTHDGDYYSRYSICPGDSVLLWPMDAKLDLLWSLAEILADRS